MDEDFHFEGLFDGNMDTSKWVLNVGALCPIDILCQYFFFVVIIIFHVLSFFFFFENSSITN